jgi:hypothetical protein
MNNSLLSVTDIDSFHENGALILKGFFDPKDEIAPIQKGIYNIIGLIIRKYKLSIVRKSFHPDCFDDGFQEILNTNRKYASEIYDAVKQIPAFIRLIGSKQNEQIVSQLLGTDIPGIAAAGYGVRIDHPFEEKFRAAWHQEFLSQLRSLQGLVFWTPLLTIDEKCGPVEFCPGSQTEGVLPVQTTDPDNPNKSGAYGMRIINEQQFLSKYEKVAPLTQPGDLIIMDWHLLHRSGKNISQRSRWSLQMRYFNFDDKMGEKISWCGSFSAGVDVKTLLPEYILD